MNILFITQYYPPETGAAAERAREFVRFLMENGHIVQILTALPNHPGGVVHEGYRNRLLLRENNDGTQVVRTYVFSSPRKTLLTRLANYLSFAFSALLGFIFVKRPDVILMTIPPLFLAATGLIYKYAMKRPLVLDVRDLWPQAAVDLGEVRESSLTRALARLEMLFYQKSDLITVVTKGILDSLVSRGIPERKIHLITNGVNTDIFSRDASGPNPYEGIGLGDKFIVVYAGVIGIQHGPDHIVKAASLLSAHKEIAIVFIGEGVKKKELRAEAERQMLKNIHFLKEEKVESLVRFLSHSHAGLATLRNIPFCNGIILVKMFSYMACSLPVVLGGYGESRCILEEAGAGLCVEAENPAQLAEAVMTLYKDQEMSKRIGARGRRYVKRFYSRRSIANKMEKVLREVVRLP